MYRIATKQDIPGIAALWQQAFHETPLLPDGPCFVAEQDGRVVAMVHVLMQKVQAQKTYTAAYLYAVATDEAFRGRGICRELMAYAERTLDADCCILVPAHKSLFSFYEKLGYRTAFTRNKTSFPGGNEISMEEYLLRREVLLSATAHVVYDDLHYAQRIYGLRFYKTACGIAAASDSFTAENLPDDLGDTPCGMIKWLRQEQPIQNGYLGFTLE